MYLNKTAIAGVLASAALMVASAGCAGKRTAPEQQEPGQAAYQQQKQAFREGLQTGQEACKEQAGMAGEAPSVIAQLTGGHNGQGCNCSCQTSKGAKAKSSIEPGSTQSGG